MTLKEKMSRIYKANQCTDMNDVHIALNDCEQLRKQYGYKPSIVNRIVSLQKKQNKLSAK